MPPRTQPNPPTVFHPLPATLLELLKPGKIQNIQDFRDLSLVLLQCQLEGIISPFLAKTIQVRLDSIALTLIGGPSTNSPGEGSGSSQVTINLLGQAINLEQMRRSVVPVAPLAIPEEEDP